MTATPRGLKIRRLTSGNRWNGNGFGYSPADYEATFAGDVVASFTEGRSSILGKGQGAMSYKSWRERVIQLHPLMRSELYAYDPDAAWSLWGDLFKPTPAMNVEVGSTVAFVSTLFGEVLDGRLQFAEVREVIMDEDSPGGCVIVHDGGRTDVDELGEVWARSVKDSLALARMRTR